MSEQRRPGDLSHLERLIDRWSNADLEDRSSDGRGMLGVYRVGE